MKHAILPRFAAWALVIPLLAVGCTPSAPPAQLSDRRPPARKPDAKSAQKAAAALAAHDPVAAVPLAEAAVLFAPRDAGPRLLLARAYLASGRFYSAEAALADALALDPGNGQAELSLALVHIARGRMESAHALILSARGKVADKDLGLALFLAGDRASGIAIMEQAARAAGADATARQNLAFGYALAGRWIEAQSVAAQDLAPEMLRVRMIEWAQLSQPRQRWDQVAALLRVTPIGDVGMPTALALAPATDANVAALAKATPAPAVAQVAAADVGPAGLAEAVAMPAVAQVAIAMPVARGPLASLPSFVAPLAPAAQSPVVKAAPAVMQNTPAFARVVPAVALQHRAPMLVARLVAEPRAARPGAAATRGQNPAGRFAVQLGAFSTAANMENAWRGTVRRIGRIAAFTPSRAMVGTVGAGTVYRLSLAGFASRGEAAGLCRQILAAQQPCFVRETAGDAGARFPIDGRMRLAMRGA